MDKIKKVYIDPRYKTSDSVSNSNFKFEIKEGFDLPDNTACYIGGISIPHTWYTVEYYNNIMYRNVKPGFDIKLFIYNRTKR